MRKGKLIGEGIGEEGGIGKRDVKGERRKRRGKGNGAGNEKGMGKVKEEGLGKEEEKD